jgi:hypothetical protein
MKAREKEPTRKTKCRWIDNIKMDLLETKLYGVDWIGLAQDMYSWRALVNVVMNLRAPENTGKVPNGCTTCGILSGAHLHRER